MSKPIAAAIDTAVFCLPTELSSLIGQYAMACPHRFTTDGFITGRCQSTDATKTTTELVIEEQTDCWHTFVSDVPLSIGETEWMVDFPARSMLVGGWIGVGLTAAAGNRVSQPDAKFVRMTDQTDWLFGIAYNQAWFRMHNGKINEIIRFGDSIPAVERRVRFKADRLTGIVSVRFSPVGFGATDSSYNLALPVPFELLRPSVVIAGPAKAVFRSGLF